MNYKEFVQTEDIESIGIMAENLRQHVHSFEPFDMTISEFEVWIKIIIDTNVDLMNRFSASMNAQKLKNAVPEHLKHLL